MTFKLFLKLINRQLAAGLDALIDSIDEADVAAFKATLKIRLHKFLGV